MLWSDYPGPSIPEWVFEPRKGEDASQESKSKSSSSTQKSEEEKNKDSMEAQHEGPQEGLSD